MNQCFSEGSIAAGLLITNWDGQKDEFSTWVSPVMPQLCYLLTKPGSQVPDSYEERMVNAMNIFPCHLFLWLLTLNLVKSWYILLSLWIVLILGRFISAGQGPSYPYLLLHWVVAHFLGEGARATFDVSCVKGGRGHQLFFSRLEYISDPIFPFSFLLFPSFFAVTVGLWHRGWTHLD